MNIPLAVADGGSLPLSVWKPRSVVEILDRAADLDLGVIAYDGGATMSYRELRTAAHRAAADARRGEPFVLHASDAETFLPALWGCILRRAVPVILPRRVAPPLVPPLAADVALLMMTSGTTGVPQLVPLTHENVIASVAASAWVNGYVENDVSLNWLPLGQVGGLMRSIREIYIGCTQVQARTASVREDPLRWLDLVDAHRATLTWGSNSAFAAAVAQRHEIPSRHRWSLACLRSVYSSGELPAARTLRAFADMLAPYGFDAGTLRIAWGMTEACFATSSASLDDAGTPVPGVLLRITGDDGSVLGEGESGHLEISGPLVSGTGWQDTGDLGRISGGRLKITGRTKDVIKLGGVTFPNREIEEVIEAMPGVDTAIACGVHTADGEALAIFADVGEERVAEVRVRVGQACAVAPRFVIPLRRDEFPRTPMGKIQRRALIEAFTAGAYDRFRRWPYDLRALPPPPGGITAAERERAARIAEVMSEVLRTPVGIGDDFFTLGAASLRVADAGSRLGCELLDLFCAPTPLALAARLMRGAAPAPSQRQESRRRRERDAVAIVGMSCRFPGAPDLNAFWRLLADGRDALTHFSEDELLASGIEGRLLADPAYVRAGMILDDIESFDAELFGFTDREAEIMDPQQRLLLECAWHALEDAGRMPWSEERIGVFAGGRISEYMLANQPPLDLYGNPADGFRQLVFNDKDYLATRLAHALDCRGPAMSLQTACSTSLVALHVACGSLLSGECDLALAGGASIRVPHKAGYQYTEGMIFSPDGHTRPFDADARGTAFGSGVGVVALRRLSDALADGDAIYAVIRGSAVNNDGAAKSAFTAPSHAGQAAVIAQALAAAAVDAQSISFVEAHGTGTAVGDPIEVAALSEVFLRAASRRGWCAIGSVKSNIGHLVQAAGIAGVIKTALMLQRRTLVPSANFRAPNPLIDFAASPFFVAAETRPWESAGAPRRAGVSAFGFGGTNAHAILEEAPPRPAPAPESERQRILPLSAKSPAALRALVEAYAERLEDESVSLRDLCASAQVGRAHLPHRVAFVASSREEMREKLAAGSVDSLRLGMTAEHEVADRYMRGGDVDWRAVQAEPWTRVALPQYPFQRKRYWISPPATARPRAEARAHPLLGRRIPSPLAEVQFEAELTAEIAPFARDHMLYGVRPLVMVGQLEMMRATAGSAAATVENVLIEQALLLGDEPRRVQTLVAPDGAVRIFSSADGTSWDLHSSARVRSVAPAARRVDLEALRARCVETLSADAVYARKDEKGAAIGPSLRRVQRVWRGDGEIVAEAALDEESAAFAPEYGAYPGLLDAFAQCGELTQSRERDALFLPTVVERATFYDRLPSRIWLALRRRGDADGEVYGVDGEIADDNGRVLVAIEGFYFKRATPSTLTRAESAYEVEWVPLEDPHDTVGCQCGRCRPRQRGAPEGGRAHTETELDLGEGRRLVARADATAEELCTEALALAQSQGGPLWLITRGAQTTGVETAPLAPDQAALWGFGRTLQREQPELRCRLIDLDPAPSDDDAEDLRRAMSHSESEIAVRAGVLYGRRLQRVRPAARVDGSYALRQSGESTIEGLALLPAPRRDPGPGEVEIEVYVTGLNFRDVLNATGRISGPLGYECSGVVARCGAGVDRFEPGTPVMAIAMHSFASHVVVDARLVIRKPRNLGFAAAGTSVIAYATAIHALLERARLRAGERVLVHTAAGGVGHAAVRVAKLAGAEVVATASPRKWPLVRAMGVERVFDSRVPGFSRELERVDVVLNTLGSEFNADNFAVLRRRGRLVELGHPQVLDIEAEVAQAAAAGVELFNFHIAQDVGLHDPDHMQALLATIAEHLELGRLPALPYRTMPIAGARRAFETMLCGVHVGKLAVVHPAAERAEFAARPDATYLITGGSGAIGTRIAEWLIERGARHLALLSRRGTARDWTADVRSFEADVADERALAAVLAQIAEEMPPLGGVVHAAGVIDDGVVPQQTRARLAAAMAPKIAGAWNLHRLTESTPLDFFVLISSVAGVWGNAGQTSYAAANAFLDQLAHFRRQRGLAATSIDYGAWRGAGMAAALRDSRPRLEPEIAIRALERALAAERAQIAVFAGNAPLAAEARPAEAAPAEMGLPPRNLEDAIERTRRHVAALAGGSNIDVDCPLPELGLDSLALLLLRGRLVAEFGSAAALPVIRFLEGHSARELARLTFENRARTSGPRSPDVSFGNRALRPAEGGAHVRAPAAKRWTSLTLIKPAGGRPPIFLVPPAARTAMMFSALAQSVDGDHPVYGLNPLGLDGRAAPHDSVEAMAAHYVAEVRSAWPSGPYILGGCCFGGQVAWEMAVQLRSEGADVPLLILVDPAAPEAAERPRVEAYIHAAEYLASRVIFHLRRRSLHKWIAARLRRESSGVEDALHRVVTAHAAAVTRYRARPFDGAVLLLQSSEYSRYGKRWRFLSRGAFEAVLFAGTEHAEILHDQRVGEIGAAVTARLAALK